MIDRHAIAATRAAAVAATKERNSLSCWTVTRPADGGTTDAESGDWTPGTETPWETNGHFSPKGDPSIARRADTALTVESPTLCVDVCEKPLRIGDTITAVRVLDNSLLNRTWRVTGEPASSHGIHRHYPLEEVTSERAVR